MRRLFVFLVLGFNNSVQGSWSLDVVVVVVVVAVKPDRRPSTDWTSISQYDFAINPEMSYLPKET